MAPRTARDWSAEPGGSRRACGNPVCTEPSALGTPNSRAVPLWSTIPAVAEGRQHWVEDRVWVLGIGPIGAGRILDDLEAMLTDG